MAFGFPALIGAGGQIGGGIADFMESRRRADIVGTQKKLAVRQSEKRQRRAVAAQSGRAAGAGVKMTGTTLEQINQTNYEYELDQEIIKESARLEQDSIKRQGMMDAFGGLAEGAVTLYEGYKPAKLTKTKAGQITPATAAGMPGPFMGFRSMGGR